MQKKMIKRSCYYCKYYKASAFSNECTLLNFENYHAHNIKNCEYINDDNTPNLENIRRDNL